MWFADGFEFGQDVAHALLRPRGLDWLLVGRHFLGIPFLESLDAPFGVDQFLGARKERMARGTDVGMGDVELRGANLVLGATRAFHLPHLIFRMNVCFHEGGIIALGKGCAREIRGDLNRHRLFL